MVQINLSIKYTIPLKQQLHKLLKTELNILSSEMLNLNVNPQSVALNYISRRKRESHFTKHNIS